MTPDSALLIAVVDDDESILKALRRLLRSYSFSPEIFDSGDVFIRAVQAGASFDCVILDIQMPGLTGFEVQANMAHLDCRIPIIFITADGDPAIRAQAEAKGAAGFLRKPFTDSQLLDAIGATTSGGASPE